MTPVAAPTTPSEIAYNRRHCRTRVVIERCFGLWKSRFRCLDKSGGTLLYTAEKACRLVIATAVLHNFCISRQIPAEVDEAVVARDAAIQPQPQQPTAQPARSLNGVELRRRLIQQF